MEKGGEGGESERRYDVFFFARVKRWGEGGFDFLGWKIEKVKKKFSYEKDLWASREKHLFFPGGGGWLFKHEERIG